MSNQIIKNESFDFENNDGLDLGEIISIVLRRKIIVGIFTIVSFAGGAIYSFSIPKLWEGNFQIVLSNESKSSALSSLANTGIAQLAGLTLGGGSNQLKTEVEILKSPSILYKVFEFVKNKKSKEIEDIDMKYVNWTRALEVELSRGTSVLNLSYRDNDKDLILPVLNKISNIYQNYSGKRRRRELQLGMQYLEDQIRKYKIKNLESLRKVDDFALAQDIGIFSVTSKSIFPQSNLNSFKEDFSVNPSVNPITTNVEYLRLEAANNLRNTNLRLEQLEKNNGDFKFLITDKTYPQLSEIQKELYELDNKLAYSLAIFLENDESISLLKEQKKQLENLLRKTYRSILETEKSSAKAAIKAAERPEGVITKYKQLYSQSLMDKRTLTTLETQYRVLELEKSRMEDPWELITRPTVLYYPVAPNKKRIALIFTVIGTLIGIITATIYDRSKNIIYSEKDLNSIVNWPVIDRFSSTDLSLWIQSLELIAVNHQKSQVGDLGILLLNELSNDENKIIKSTINKNLNKKSLIISDNLKNLLDCDIIIPILKLGIADKKKLIKLKENIKIQGKRIIGLIIIE
tara:strand:- start:87 stop:1811 length:1725 start_codon:yes stop_codon:yes gene_type:complete